MNGIIYLIYVREFLLQDIPIYKIGRTEDIIERYKQYPKGSILVYSCYSDDIIRDENSIKKIFTEKFLKRSDIGVEYFEGDLSKMLIMIHDIILSKQSFVIKSKNFIVTLQKFIVDNICIHDNNFLPLNDVYDLFCKSGSGFTLTKNSFKSISNIFIDKINSVNSVLGFHNKIFIKNIHITSVKNNTIEKLFDIYQIFIDKNVEKSNNYYDRISQPNINKSCSKWIFDNFKNITFRKKDFKIIIEKNFGILINNLWINNKKEAGWAHIKWKKQK